MNLEAITPTPPTQEACIKFLESARWEDRPVCPYCRSSNSTSIPKELKHHCNKCNSMFSVTVGTIFHDSKVLLWKWFKLINLMLNAKRGLSACQAARDLKTRRPTVWSMMHRIRSAMEHSTDLLEGIIEMDETYVGGKPRYRHKSKIGTASIPIVKSKRGRGTKKLPVVGMVERKGEVRAKMVERSMLKASYLEKLVKNNVDTKTALLFTDCYNGYNGMRDFISHFTVNHSIEYENCGVHTNNIEGFWSIVKRGIIGQYYHVSKKYMNFYLNEFCYKYNNRKLSQKEVFEDLLVRMLKRRGKYY